MYTALLIRRFHAVSILEEDLQVLLLYPFMHTVASLGISRMEYIEDVSTLVGPA